MSTHGLAQIESKASTSMRNSQASHPRASKSMLPPVPRKTESGMLQKSPRNQNESNTSVAKSSMEPARKPSDAAPTARSITPSRQNLMNRLPTIKSGGSSTRGRKNPYEMNYSLQIESPMLSSRQNQYHVNNYYNRLINKRIFNSVKPSPLLAAEQRTMRHTHKTLRPISTDKYASVPPGIHSINIKKLESIRDKDHAEPEALPADDSIFGPAEEQPSTIEPSKFRDASRMTDLLQNTTLP